VRDPEGNDATDVPPAPATKTPSSPGIGSAAASEPPTPKGANPLRLELLVASKDVAEADQQRAWLQSQGAQLLRRRTLTHLGWVIAVYRLAPGVPPATVSAALLQQWPDAMPESNQRYPALGDAGAGGPIDYARKLIGWPESGCGRKPRIAVLDGPVNGALTAFGGRKFQLAALAPADAVPNYNHGTAVAALIVGHGSPRGLLPEAELVIGVIMRDDSGKAYTTTEWVLRGLDWVLGLEPAPSALNLSFGGPESAQLARALERVLQTTRVIAAAGNDGKRAPVFPASHPGVIGVSALDIRLQRWPNANTGEHVAITAPGVDVWTLDGAGHGYYASGTSFATPFVTAAIASSAPSQAQMPDWLARHTRDLGAPRRDSEYGQGVLTLHKGCSS
jgi:subtilisin family serine protease